MKIAVLSGKGGAGKTLLAVNLADILPDGVYVDCDVEEPNGDLFFKPEISESLDIGVKLPKVNQDLCIGCRKCVEFCRFNALAYISDRLLVFDEVCHSCGGCTYVCDQGAIREEEHIMGQVEIGYSKGTKVMTGRMHVGEASGVAIINKLNDLIKEEETAIIDCPPGSACVVMESIKEADYCLIVAEPTVFGVHNMAMVHELVRKFKKPAGAIINKTMSENNPAKEYCLSKQLPILGVLPYDALLAELNSDGKIAVREKKNYEKFFQLILEDVLEEVGYETASRT